MTGSTNKDNSYLWNVLAQAKQGETLAYQEFFNVLYTPVYRYLLVRLKHKEAAEDCAQITFSKVFLHFHTIKQGETSPLQYLFTVARNTLIDETRKKKTVTLDEEEWGSYFSPENIEKKTELSNIYSIILESIHSFESETRDIIILKLLDNLSHSEIAEITGKSEVSVRKAYSRGMANLKSMLEAQGITYETYA